MIDRGAFLFFWIRNNMRTDTCTCGEREGHAGWIICFHNDLKELTA